MVIFLAITVVPLCLFWLWPHSKALDSEFKEVHERHLLLANNLSSALSRYYRDAVAGYEIVSRNLVDGKDFAFADELLTNLSFRHICVAELKGGRVVSEVDTQAFPCPEIIPAKRFAYFQSVAKEERTILTGVLPAPDGQPTLYFLKIYGDRLVVGAVFTDYFVKLGKQISFGRLGHAAIVDQNGRVLAHPLDSWIAEMRDISKVSVVQRMLAGETGVETFYSPALKDDMVAGFTAVDGPGWGVMVPQPVAELKEKAAGIQLSAMVVFAAGLALAAVLAAVLSFALVRSLKTVTLAARAMASGDSSARAAAGDRVFGFDEIENLKTAFNKMGDRIEEVSSRELEARQRAEKANETKSLFLANMSHELRTPLNAIIGFADMMLASPLKLLGHDKRQEYVNDISKSAKHLHALIDDLLDLSKIEAGQFELYEEPTDLSDLLRDAITLVGTAAREREMDLSIEELAGTVSLFADERVIKQAVLNLLSNALRYTQIGGRVILRSSLRASGDLEIVIEDNGPGIPRESIERLMQPFQRRASDVKQGIQGTGLGLSIVSRLIELHGGTFLIESDKGQGTKALICLPKSRVRATDERHQAPRSA
ncbi:sensor histidine kinase [Pelagibius sp. Alg239-R121]|uniref:sensor histidine kinase n=1 Tax=Pelagibius sp. Alg239-R121 TaxID=2993448 RepID=UPI0024A76160|nr:sensor histidine kinase [Pelagibius sp. Alg239-R121]